MYVFLDWLIFSRILSIHDFDDMHIAFLPQLVLLSTIYVFLGSRSFGDIEDQPGCFFWFPQTIVDLSKANKPERFGWTFWNIFGSHVAKAVVVNQNINLNDKIFLYPLCLFHFNLDSFEQNPTSSSLKKRAGGSRGARTVLATFHQGFGSDDIDDMFWELPWCPKNA